jgi:hypothetical protein
MVGCVFFTPVLPRPLWNGTPIKGGDLFTLRRQREGELRVAVCAVWTHTFGWELRLLGDSAFRRSRICRDHDQLLETMELWKTVLVVSGWT